MRKNVDYFITVNGRSLIGFHPDRRCRDSPFVVRMPRHHFDGHIAGFTFRYPVSKTPVLFTGRCDLLAVDIEGGRIDRETVLAFKTDNDLLVESIHLIFPGRCKLNTFHIPHLVFRKFCSQRSFFFFVRRFIPSAGTDEKGT